MRRRGTSCMVPSPLCGRLATFVDSISKTRIKISFSMKSNKPAQKSVLFSVQTAMQRCSRICKSITQKNNSRRFHCAPLGCSTHALMLAKGFIGIGFTETLVDFMGKAWFKISIITICLSPTVLIHRRARSSNWTCSGIRFGACSMCGEEWEEF